MGHLLAAIVLTSGIACLASLSARPARPLIFSSPETEPVEEAPPDFPYWEQVTRRRYDGPTVIYLGANWVLTARHVGPGEVLLGGDIVRPIPSTRHTLMNVDGTLADALVFELDPSAPHAPLPLLPIARTPPRPGEEVLLIGWGRERGRTVRWLDHDVPTVGFEWSDSGRKHWGTNRILKIGQWLRQGDWLTRALVTRFDPTGTPDATEHEAQAATGDSGGGLFVKRDDGWELAGIMVSASIARQARPQMATFGDFTYAADLSSYREEILRWTRPSCSNEIDDDGDDLVDYPDDPDCEGPLDPDERTPDRRPILWTGALGAGLLAGAVLAALGRKRLQRGRRTPSSTRPSTAA